MDRLHRRFVPVFFACLLLLGLAVCATLVSQPAVAATGDATPTPATVTTAIGTPVLTTTAPSGDVIVLAAASLTESFTDLGQQFELAHPGTKVTFSFAGSQQLAQQINQGAPADVFASANTAQMKVAIGGGRVVSGTQQTFAKNRLMVVYPIDNPGKISGLKDLAKPGLRLVLAAKEVPVGQYALDFLDKADLDQALGPTFKADVLKNVVSYEQDVKAVLSKVVLGEADAGIVYSTDAASEKTGKTARLDVPDSLNSIAVYPIAVLHDSTQPELAQAFVDLTLSPQGQEILAKYGFLPGNP
jgi:molybdate transport system substrate-binding protein